MTQQDPGSDTTAKAEAIAAQLRDAALVVEAIDKTREPKPQPRDVIGPLTSLGAALLGALGGLGGVYLANFSDAKDLREETAEQTKLLTSANAKLGTANSAIAMQTEQIEQHRTTLNATYTSLFAQILAPTTTPEVRFGAVVGMCTQPAAPGLRESANAVALGLATVCPAQCSTIKDDDQAQLCWDICTGWAAMTKNRATFDAWLRSKKGPCGDRCWPEATDETHKDETKSSRCTTCVADEADQYGHVVARCSAPQSNVTP